MAEVTRQAILDEDGLLGQANLAVVDLLLPTVSMDCDSDLLQVLRRTIDLPADNVQELPILARALTSFSLNERGLGVATAVGLLVGPEAEEVRVRRFCADRPFAFVIRDRATSMVLVAGYVTRPDSSRRDASSRK